MGRHLGKMTEFIKPLVGVIIIAIGISISLLGINLVIQMSMLSFVGAIALIFLGAGTCEIGYAVVTGGDIHESFLFKLLTNLGIKQ